MSYPPPNLSPRTDSSPAVPGAHAADHTAERNAINAIVAELGANPSLGYPTLQALLEAILTKIGLAQTPTEGGGSGSGGTGGSGGSGSGGSGGSSGGLGPSSDTSPYTPTGVFPIDLTSLTISPASGGVAGHNLGKWFTGNLTAYGFYSRTLVTEEERDSHYWLTFVNLDEPATRQSYQLESFFYGAPTQPLIGLSSKLTQLVRAGRLWNATTHAFEDTGLLGSNDADTQSNYVGRSEGYIWATYRAVWKLDASGTVTKVADVPNGYYTQQCVLSELGSWFVLRSDTLADSNAQAVKIASFDLDTKAFSVIANMPVAQAASYTAMFNGGDGSSPGAAVISGGRLLGMTSPSSGTLQVLTKDLVATQPQSTLFDAGWTAQQTLPSPAGWLLAISKNGSQYQITAAGEIDSFTFVAPTAEPIHNLHWHVGYEGLVARWNQGTKLCEQWFSKPV